MEANLPRPQTQMRNLIISGGARAEQNFFLFILSSRNCKILMQFVCSRGLPSPVPSPALKFISQFGLFKCRSDKYSARFCFPAHIYGRLAKKSRKLEQREKNVFEASARGSCRVHFVFILASAQGCKFRLNALGRMEFANTEKRKLISEFKASGRFSLSSPFVAFAG